MKTLKLKPKFSDNVIDIVAYMDVYFDLKLSAEYYLLAAHITQFFDGGEESLSHINYSIDKLDIFRSVSKKLTSIEEVTPLYIVNILLFPSLGDRCIENKTYTLSLDADGTDVVFRLLSNEQDSDGLTGDGIVSTFKDLHLDYYNQDIIRSIGYRQPTEFIAWHHKYL